MAGPPETEGKNAPWGRISALLAACAATLIGVARGLDPDVILVRAIVAAGLLGALTLVVRSVIHRFWQSA